MPALAAPPTHVSHLALFAGRAMACGLIAACGDIFVGPAGTPALHHLLVVEHSVDNVRRMQQAGALHDAQVVLRPTSRQGDAECT